MTGFGPHIEGRPLGAGRIYDIVRARTFKKFGKAMGLHDFRRAAATFLAMDAPDKIGLIPGMLQHASPEVGEQHYNLARSVEASRRFAAHLSQELGAGSGRSHQVARAEPCAPSFTPGTAPTCKVQASIDDQVRLCRERLERDGHELVQVYSDRAVSGATLMRPGIQLAHAGCEPRRFDVVYAEALDRISRDQEDAAGFFKRMASPV